MQRPIFEDSVSGKYTLYPDNTWSERSALLMVINNTEPLVAIPIRFRTRAVCLIAVYYRASNIWHVPNELQEELSKYAFKSNYTAIQYIREKYKTRDMCEEAVIGDGMLLIYVPYEWRDITMCSFACQNNVKALQYVPDELLANEKWLMVDQFP